MVMDAATDDAGIADYQPVVKAANNYAKTKQLHAKARETIFDRPFWLRFVIARKKPRRCTKGPPDCGSREPTEVS